MPGDRFSALYLTVTRTCNLSCGFCPMDLGPGSMDSETARAAVSLFMQMRDPGARPKIRFFGGEPLLCFPLIREVVESFPEADNGRRPHFSFPTNGLLITGEVEAYLHSHPELETAPSQVRDPKLLARLPNAVVTLPISPDSAKGMPRYLARLLGAGIDRFNFLPSFYVAWNELQFAELERAFKLAAGLLNATAERGRGIEVRNISTDNPTPLFNHGMVVDHRGDLYPSNAFLCEPFEHLRAATRMGSVKDPAAVRWDLPAGLRWDDILRESLSPEVHEATMRVDSLLTDFVHRLTSCRGTDP